MTIWNPHKGFVVDTSIIVLRYIDKYKQEYGVSPAIKDIVENTRVRSNDTVFNALKKLRKNKLIDWHELPSGKRMSRSIWITKCGEKYLLDK